MSAQEIYEQIVGQGLYEFKAKDPSNIVRGQLRRHCVGAKGGASKKCFRMTDDGLFALLESPEGIAEDVN
jgi:restriction system protein